MGRAVFPPCCLTWDQTMVEVIKKMATTFKRSMHTLPHSVPLTQQQATANPCLWQRLLDTHGQVWVSFLWDHYSFLLDPGAYKVLFVPSKTLFPQSCVSSGSSGKEFQKNIYFCFDYAKAFDCVDHNKLWKILQKMGIPDHQTCLLRNLCAGQTEIVRINTVPGLVPNWERSMSRLYIVTLII